MAAPASPMFEKEIAFLRANGPIEILEAPGGGRLAVSAKYQGRVMTSAVRSPLRSSNAFVATVVPIFTAPIIAAGIGASDERPSTSRMPCTAASR